MIATPLEISKKLLYFMIAIFILIVAFFVIPFSDELRHSLFPFAGVLGLIFHILGVALIYFALKLKKDDDYPDYAFKVAKAVAKHKGSKGILVCGTGIGMGIAANKVRGIRAAMAYDLYSAKMSRLHNDSNILELRGRKFPYKKNEQIVMAWLKTPFSGGARHKRRIAKLNRK